MFMGAQAPRVDADTLHAAAWVSYLTSLEHLGAQANFAVPSGVELAALLNGGQAEHLVSFATQRLQASLESEHVPHFWSQLVQCEAATAGGQDEAVQEQQLLQALQGLVQVVDEHCGQLASLAEALLHLMPAAAAGRSSQLALRLAWLPQQHRTSVSALLMATAKVSLSGLLQVYFGTKLDQLSAALDKVGGTTSTPTAAARHGAGREPEDGGDGDGDVMMASAESTPRAGAPGGTAPQLVGLSPAALATLDVGKLRPSTLAVVTGQLGSAWAARLQRVCGCCHALALDAAAEEAHTAVLSRHVSQYLTSTASGIFDRPVLPAAVQYVARVPLEFLKLLMLGEAQDAAQQHRLPLAQQRQQPRPAAGGAAAARALPPGAGRGPDVAVLLQEWRLRLTYYLYETLGALRIREMFSIVVDYPDSAPAVLDTAECLRHTNLAHHFVASFRGALSQRLLHAGVSANSIIHQYVSTIRALQQMDPSGSLLASVAQPICEYLRARPDTIRCLVTMVTASAEGAEGGGQSLLEELQGHGQERRDAEAKREETDGDEAAWQAVQAAALDASHAALAAAAGAPPKGAADVVSMLIGVFGSTDVFIDEYRSMLGGRLLYAQQYECDADIRTVELLKLRFGEAALHGCEVMLKDVADSKRCNATIHALAHVDLEDDTLALPRATSRSLPEGSAEALGVLSTTIMSYMYWPQGEAEDSKLTAQQLKLRGKLLLPAAMLSAMEQYAARYQSIKSPRCLEWRTTLGVVELDLSVGGVEFSAAVSPTLATLLLQFHQHEQRTVAQLAAAVGLPAAQVRRPLMFWVNAGVLLEAHAAAGAAAADTPAGGRYANPTYQRARQVDGSMQGTRLTDFGFDESAAGGIEHATLSSSERLWEEMSMYENYVLGMLTNYKQLPLDRLHKMLQLFVVSPRFEKSLEQLAAFLVLLQGQDKVMVENGVYRIWAGGPTAPMPGMENAP